MMNIPRSKFASLGWSEAEIDMRVGKADVQIYELPGLVSRGHVTARDASRLLINELDIELSVAFMVGLLEVVLTASNRANRDLPTSPEIDAVLNRVLQSNESLPIDRDGCNVIFGTLIPYLAELDGVNVDLQWFIHLDAMVESIRRARMKLN
jgi:hypothetical protein